MRHCEDKSWDGSLGCECVAHEDEEICICHCDTHLCNGAVMTSSFGHVITVVALLITAYLL